MLTASALNTRKKYRRACFNCDKLWTLLEVSIKINWEKANISIDYKSSLRTTHAQEVNTHFTPARKHWQEGKKSYWYPELLGQVYSHTPCRLLSQSVQKRVRSKQFWQIQVSTRLELIGPSLLHPASQSQSLRHQRPEIFDWFLRAIPQWRPQQWYLCDKESKCITLQAHKPMADQLLD